MNKDLYSCTKVGVILTMMNRLSGGSHTYVGRSWFANFGFAVLSSMIVYTPMIYLPPLLTNNLYIAPPPRDSEINELEDIQLEVVNMFNGCCVSTVKFMYIICTKYAVSGEARAPSSAKKIDLAFHDCNNYLYYSNDTIF